MSYGKWSPLRRTEAMGKLEPSRKSDTDSVPYLYLFVLLAYILFAS